jgi:FkbM family methyltransferase
VVSAIDEKGGPLTLRSTLLALLPGDARRRLQRGRRRLYEAIGDERFSRPAQFDLERRLLQLLPERGGFFVEAGANDGYTQSNTYFLERMRGWHGLLVEPIPRLARECRRERSRSRVVQCALGGPSDAGQTVTMVDANLMSIVKGSRGAQEEQETLRRAMRVQGLTSTPEVVAPVRTLTSILDEAPPARIDFLSLDLEGYELRALRGLDMDKYRPELVLIEGGWDDEVASLMRVADYVPEEIVAEHDQLFRDAHARI